MVRRLPVPAILAIALVLIPAVSAGSGAGLPALHAQASATLQTAALPTIKQVRPLKAEIGGTLTITGRNYLPGKGNTTVVFLRDGAPAVFLKASKATKTRLTVKLTSKLGKYLIAKNTGEKGPTKFRLRVLAARFGASFTSKKLSPTISAGEQGPGDGSSGPGVPNCTLKSAKAAPGSDADGDALTNGRELQIKTDPCAADSDGDKIPDGYEYESALDLNLRALPYPGKRPYPNPLDPSDAGTDYDGDGLTLSEEHTVWVVYGASAFPLLYSDGTQTSMGPVQVTPQTAWADISGDGFLTDDEKDADNDGLTNWDEAHGRMTPAWWGAVWDTEKPFTVAFLATDWLDPDTDGDTLPDGPDDVDHDGYANQDEVTRGFYVDRDNVVQGSYWVQPFNPCLPDPLSRTCPKHPPVKDTYPPFRTGDIEPGETFPLVWPRPD